MILNKQEIQNTDMTFLQRWCHAADRPNVASNNEHYKLLTYLSLQYDNIVFGDVGMRFGSSAYAMARNPNNKVKAFELNEGYRPNFDVPNIEVSYKNVVDEPELLLDCNIIMIDIDPHDGVSEKKILMDLLKLDWLGIMLFDDIGDYWPKMKECWESIVEVPKHDITEYGHFSGTGLVCITAEEIIFQ